MAFVRYWRHKDGIPEKSDQVVYFGRDILKDYIERNLDKTAEWLNASVNSNRGLHTRIELHNNVLDERSYFMNIPITLDNGEIVVISRRWGASGPTLPLLLEFEENMKLLGYIISDEPLNTKAILFNIGKTYRDNMTNEELYEATRGTWKIGERKNEIAYAIAFAKGKMREIYNIKKWDIAGTNEYKTRRKLNIIDNDRWEFIGKVSEEDIREEYLDIPFTWKRGNVNPVQIIDLEEIMNTETRANLDVIQREHVLSAIEYVGKNGKELDNGILYLTTPVGYMAVAHNKQYFALKATTRVAYFYAINETPNGENGIFSDEQMQALYNIYFNSLAAKKRLEELKFNIVRLNKPKPDPDPQNPGRKKPMSKNLSLLKQFHQIILYGPPGTGKTLAAKEIIAELFGTNIDELHKYKKDRAVDEAEELIITRFEQLWDIVQFHPSYNYEDFVRGVQVSTPGEHVTYTTKDRIFGEMCKLAKESEKNPKPPFVLIIDEINRANVSAVFGELIYALEYRGESVKTPYKVTSGSQDINIPENLYIIGTMNSADRTIGQIDYAVRRRFAFVELLPDRKIITDEVALKFFDDVDNIFKDHISQDFDANDVRIGHSYFLASGNELTNKILYQVVPILWEYLKDGVLKESARKPIKDIEDNVKKP